MLTEPHGLVLKFAVYVGVLDDLGGKGHATNVVLHQVKTILNLVKDIDLTDPYNWPDSINSYLRVDLVKLGPRRNINI